MEECLAGGVLTLVPVRGPSVLLSVAPWGRWRVLAVACFTGCPRHTPLCTWLLHGLPGSSGVKGLCTWMQVPVHSLQRLQDRAQRLAGICEILVMGSIFSGHPMLTWGRTQGAASGLSSPACLQGSPKWGTRLLKPGGEQTRQRESPKSFLTSQVDHGVSVSVCSIAARLKL